MPQLLELQRAFWQAVRSRRAPPAQLDTWLTPSARQPASERLAVYHQAYWQRQLSYLGDTFPRTLALLQPARGRRLLLDYIEACPGSHPCIERIGAQLASFLAEQRDIDSRAAELARLEWAFVEALLAPDADSTRELPRDRGARLAECRFEMAPSLRLERVSPGALAWLEGDETSTSGGSEPEAWVVFYRSRHRVQRLGVSAEEARPLELAMRGATLAEICATFAHLSASEASRGAAGILANWLARGWIARVV